MRSHIGWRENKVFLMRVWKPLPIRRVDKNNGVLNVPIEPITLIQDQGDSTSIHSLSTKLDKLSSIIISCVIS